MSEAIETIPAIARYWAENNPEAEVFTFVNKHGRYGVYTTRDIYTLAGKFAARIRGYGFAEGDVIANSLPNSPERLISDLGIIFAGCVTVNCQILESDGADFWNTARLGGCRGVILSPCGDDTALQLFAPYMSRDPSISGCQDVTVPNVDSLKKVITCTRDCNNESDSLLSSLSSSIDDEFYANPRPDDLAALFTTSGTTGFCKLIPRSHSQILLCGRSFKGAKDTKYFSDRPFGWMGGFPFDYLAHCSPRILQDKLAGDHAVTSLDLWTVIGREKCNGAAILPVQVVELIQEFSNKKPDFKLSFLVTGGQPLKKNLAEALGLLTDALVVSYSSTEAAMVCVGLVTSASQVKDFYSGAPSQSVEVKIIDEEGNVLKADEEGEILVKSPLIMTGYYGQQARDKTFTQDGWYRTGDRGCLDASGHLYCVGRSGDVIFRGALIIYASWPEKILAKIQDVEDAIVVGLPDETGDDQLYACVIRKRDSKMTEENLLEHYNTHLVNTRGAGEIGLKRILFFETFPELSTGKINKKELKRKVIEMLDSTTSGPIE